VVESFRTIEPRLRRVHRELRWGAAVVADAAKNVG
jgi:hypothetical protein